MPATGRYTHALISRVPPTFQTLKTIDGSCIDLERARAQQERLVGCLRDLSVDVLELPPDDDSPCSVFINDCAVVLQGIALICRPGGGERLADLATVRSVLRNELGMNPVEFGSNTALLNASDVLFTGKEFFCGARPRDKYRGSPSLGQHLAGISMHTNQDGWMSPSSRPCDTGRARRLEC